MCSSAPAQQHIAWPTSNACCSATHACQQSIRLVTAVDTSADCRGFRVLCRRHSWRGCSLQIKDTNLFYVSRVLACVLPACAALSILPSTLLLSSPVFPVLLSSPVCSQMVARTAVVLLVLALAAPAFAARLLNEAPDTTLTCVQSVLKVRMRCVQAAECVCVARGLAGRHSRAASTRVDAVSAPHAGKT